MWFGIILHHFSHRESNLKLYSNLKLENFFFYRDKVRQSYAVGKYARGLEVNSCNVRTQPKGEFNQKNPLKLKLREHIKSMSAFDKQLQCRNIKI